jgi:hypothetical protein
VHIDIAEPAVLWARWGALAAALTTLGYDDVYWCDPEGAHHDDHGGNWSRLVLVEGGRAALFGYDHEYSDTAWASPPIDLLAGAPDWLPWPELTRHVEQDQLGYLHWYEQGRWTRVAYPAPDLTDGLVPTAGAVLSPDRARAALAEIVFEWGQHQPTDEATERAEVAVAADRLLAAARAGTLDEAALAELLGRVRPHRPVDPAAGLTMAARAGLTPGTTAPLSRATGAAPAHRPRLLSEDQHDQLVWAAMQQSGELPRPTPAPTPELAALVDWVRGRAPAADGVCTLLVEVTDTSLRQHPGPRPPAARPDEDRWQAFNEAGALARRLRAAEAHPEHGHWLYLRVETTTESHVVTRYYDSWPDWLPAEPHGGPWRTHLRDELDRRLPAWRPAWEVLLDPEVARTGPPPPFTLP